MNRELQGHHIHSILVVRSSGGIGFDQKLTNGTIGPKPIYKHSTDDTGFG